MPRKSLTSLALLLSISPSFASMTELLSTKQLAQGADSIRMGEVTAQWSSWDAEKKMVYTYTKLKVSETVKGQAHDEVLIKQPGGEVGNVGMRVHGMAVFRKGERALVFLRKGEGDYPALVGLSQGKFNIVRDRQTGDDKAVFSAPSDGEFYRRGERGAAQRLSAASVRREQTLKSLIEEIRGAQ